MKHPIRKRLTFTHIFGKSLEKGIAKAEVISISPMAIVLPGSFTQSVCKMWVKDRRKRRGFYAVPSPYVHSKGLRGALPAPGVRCSHASGWWALDLRMERHTERLVRYCFYRRERFTYERPNSIMLSICKEQVYFSTNVQNMQEVPLADGAACVPTAEAEGLMPRSNKLPAHDASGRRNRGG